MPSNNALYLQQTGKYRELEHLTIRLEATIQGLRNEKEGLQIEAVTDRGSVTEEDLEGPSKK